MAKKQMILNLFGGLGGFHMGAWRMPGQDGDLRQAFPIFKWQAQEAERGKMHALFLADRLWMNPELGDTPAHSVQHPLDPVSLLSALSQCTTRVGLIATRATSYSPAYSLARELATLDEISGGRAAWNVVTGGGAETPNFGVLEPLPHDVRYALAEELVDAVKGLWDSWDDDAFLYDKLNGHYWDVDKVHSLNFDGEHVKVQGPITVRRPPQGHLPLVQAGTSPAGMQLGGRVGDLIFDLSTTVEKNRDTRSKFRAIAADHGRDPDHCKYIPDIHMLVAATESEARDRLAQLEEQVDATAAIPQLSQILGMDVAALDLDGPLPTDIPMTDGYQSWQRRYMDMAQAENLTVRQLARRAVQFPSQVVAGTAASIADRMQEWFENDAADGFMCRPAQLRTVTDIIDGVIPELQRRGLFRTDYAGTTLRENLGLPRPASRYASAIIAGA